MYRRPRNVGVGIRSLRHSVNFSLERERGNQLPDIHVGHAPRVVRFCIARTSICLGKCPSPRQLSSRMGTTRNDRGEESRSGRGGEGTATRGLNPWDVEVPWDGPIKRRYSRVHVFSCLLLCLCCLASFLYNDSAPRRFDANTPQEIARSVARPMILRDFIPPPQRVQRATWPRRDKSCCDGRNPANRNTTTHDNDADIRGKHGRCSARW